MRLYLWERTIYRKTLQTFFLFLTLFYLFYSFVDYSTHINDFLKENRIQLIDLVSYYGYQFIKRAELLIPLALLIATIKQLTGMNLRNELLALQASGLSFHKICRPILCIASCAVIFSALSAQYLIPTAHSYIDKFSDEHLHTSHNKEASIHVIHLKDDSKLLYQTIRDGQFFDLFWVRSTDDIFRIKYLTCDPINPIGTYVDHLERNDEGMLIKTESFERLEFKGIAWDKKMPRRGYIATETRSIQELFSLLAKKTNSYSHNDLLSQLLFKLTMPFFSLLVVIAISPFCVKSSRSLPLFMLYAIALFSFIAFFTFMDASLILGENSVLSPFYAIVLPFGSISLLFLWRWVRC